MSVSCLDLLGAVARPGRRRGWGYAQWIQNAARIWFSGADPPSLELVLLRAKLAGLGGVHDFRSFALLITAHSASSKMSG